MARRNDRCRPRPGVAGEVFLALYPSTSVALVGDCDSKGCWDSDNKPSRFQSAGYFAPDFSPLIAGHADGERHDAGGRSYVWNKGCWYVVDSDGEHLCPGRKP